MSDDLIATLNELANHRLAYERGEARFPTDVPSVFINRVASALKGKGEECERLREVIAELENDEEAERIARERMLRKAAEDEYMRLASQVSRIKEALEEIANMKPTKVADGLVTGPLAHFDACKRIARSALSQSVDFGEPQRESNAQTLSSETECSSSLEIAPERTCTTSANSQVTTSRAAGGDKAAHSISREEHSERASSSSKLPHCGSPDTESTACYNNGLKVLGESFTPPETECSRRMLIRIDGLLLCTFDWLDGGHIGAAKADIRAAQNELRKYIETLSPPRLMPEQE